MSLEFPKTIGKVVRKSQIRQGLTQTGGKTGMYASLSVLIYSLARIFHESILL